MLLELPFVTTWLKKTHYEDKVAYKVAWLYRFFGSFLQAARSRMKFARHLKKLYVKKLRYYLVVDMNLPKKDIFTSRNHWKISIKLTDLEIAKHTTGLIIFSWHTLKQFNKQSIMLKMLSLGICTWNFLLLPWFKKNT